MAELGQGEDLWISALKVKLPKRADCTSVPHNAAPTLHEIQDSPRRYASFSEILLLTEPRKDNPHDIKTMQKHKDPRTILEQLTQMTSPDQFLGVPVEVNPSPCLCLSVIKALGGNGVKSRLQGL